MPIKETKKQIGAAPFDRTNPPAIHEMELNDIPTVPVKVTSQDLRNAGVITKALGRKPSLSHGDEFLFFGLAYSIANLRVLASQNKMTPAQYTSALKKLGTSMKRNNALMVQFARMYFRKMPSLYDILRAEK